MRQEYFDGILTIRDVRTFFKWYIVTKTNFDFRNIGQIMLLHKNNIAADGL